MTLMTMPMQGSDAYDESERTTNVDSYRITCTSFIEDISKDYLAWVDRYDLPKEEDARRRIFKIEIDSIIDNRAQVGETVRKLSRNHCIHYALDDAVMET